jgi:hypothetical protein
MGPFALLGIFAKGKQADFHFQRTEYRTLTIDFFNLIGERIVR